MLQKTQGIVLHSLKYKDTSIIVDIYTEVSGRASFRIVVSQSDARCCAWGQLHRTVYPFRYPPKENRYPFGWSARQMLYGLFRRNTL